MAHSLSPECTPLKHEYDACFNTWFEGYLEPAIANANTKGHSQSQRIEYSKQKKEEYDRKCGSIWAEYKDCVQKAVTEKGLGGLLSQARQENPLREPPPPDASGSS
ncbi:mitochondrial distribution/morphology family 35/apoptosis [Suillus fuscotomentosus]|uniref:Mitochondrial distribution/morphology family 35/apoptosis n=3 Tax=Suillus TaxID=5379 RepID=A0A9P7FIP5_9AGAM|nr:mitochondrial distribution/morphology family 35/apoptosis [Suillus plorans]XP_041222282.1 mitochondrial distribution/morphology family 35/apoptosis [Suillus fuscotomentosus]XP_041299564.1 mitochondrial distribution/morphology family 35/apoptosis [Suillus discolor]KAG1786757.1 mitochondrial distribution/morphology family 35/apoptosis [Suillus plorans]KAG1896706.1 mitochondrial distribution/morphology family 35/apoptosis [Suillus fuscotomentosus]KAG2119738.1 mitochondrial distribution/morphol